MCMYYDEAEEATMACVVVLGQDWLILVDMQELLASVERRRLRKRHHNSFASPGNASDGESQSPRVPESRRRRTWVTATAARRVSLLGLGYL